MQKKAIILLFVLILGFAASANATLIDRGTGMMYDTDQDITWLQDANYAATSGYDSDGQMNWFEATEWASQLEFGGYEDWRLPSFETNGVNELGYMYWQNLGGNTIGFDNLPRDLTAGSVTLYNIQVAPYWTSYEGLYDTAMTHSFAFSYTEPYEKIFDSSAWAVRDGDFGPSVSTEQPYLSDYLTLGDTFSFEYWWEMEPEPTEFNFDLMFFNGTDWELIGAEWTVEGSSSDWLSASLLVPEWARGLESQIMFSLFDWGQATNPTVYLRNIGTNSAPVPEPSTIVLFGFGIVSLAAYGRRKAKH
jgi:hypothetical protein